MDEGDNQRPFTTPSGVVSPMRASLRNRSRDPHHRRRRHRLAVAAIALVVLVLSVINGGSSGRSASPARRVSASYLAELTTVAGTGAGSLAVDQLTAENAAIDRTLAYTPLVRVAGAQHRELALTFDDGPGPFTPQLLTVLEREGVPATFFAVGVLERYFHSSTAQELADGDVIGDHTEAHAPMSKLTPAEQRTQLLDQVSAVGTYGVPFPRLFRPPYGLFDADTLTILRGFRMLMVMWTVDTEDYRLPGVAAIVRSALSGARPGAIILMHDAGGQRQETIKALPLIVAALRRRGYRLVTVPRLLLDNPPPAAQTLPAGLAGGGG